MNEQMGGWTADRMENDRPDGREEGKGREGEKRKKE